MSQRSVDQRWTGRADSSPARAPTSSERLSRFFEELASTGFFGKVVIAYQNGKVCDVKIEQTKKLEEL
jgi:hypothetical protein